MSTALRLIRDTGGDDGGLPSLDAWELYMRGAGRAECTVRDGLATMRMLERHADKTVEQLQAVDVSRFLARPEIGPSSRTAYFSAIRGFFVWYAHNGGADVTARLPRPRSPQSTPPPHPPNGLSLPHPQSHPLRDASDQPPISVVDFPTPTRQKV
jgi:integrase/recombinase XerD